MSKKIVASEKAPKPKNREAVPKGKPEGLSGKKPKQNNNVISAKPKKQEQVAFTITISGRCISAGWGRITKAQYEYWSEHLDLLTEAMNGNEITEDEGGKPVPVKARMARSYYDEYRYSHA